MKLIFKNPLVYTLAFVFVLWYGLVNWMGIKEIFIPSMTDTFKALKDLSITETFWLDVWGSWKRVFLGFLLSILVAYPLMIAALMNEPIKKSIFYIVEFFRYLPIPVFIPLTILWFGIDDMSKIVIVFLGTFAQMIPMFYDSAMLLDKKYDAFQYGLKWSNRKYIKHIIIPGSLPYILDNSRLCFGWAWTYLIIAELLGAEDGMGYAIIRAQRYLATDKIFAYIIVIGLIGVIFDRLLNFTKKKLFKWHI